MAPRAYWKGYLKLSLVSCPIALYPATSSSERVSFNRINRETGNRLKQLLVDSESEEPVEKDDIARGYPVGKGEYVLVEDDELEKIRIESTHTIDINSFVPRAEIDDRYLGSSYYLAPTDKVGQEAFVVMREAMRDRDMVALGRIVLSRREHVVMLEPFDKGILAATLRYAYEVRDQSAYFEDIDEIKLPGEMKDLAAHIVETKSGHFDPKDYEDHYETAVIDLIRKKQAGRPIETEKPVEEQPRVIKLMDALRASVEGDARKKPAAARREGRRPAAKGKKRSAG
jgi:DNA end-binding protein Ku